MKNPVLRLLPLLAILASCASPQPIYVVQPVKEVERKAPTKPAHSTKTVTANNNDGNSNARGKVIDGTFILDTPPELVEPPQTLNIEGNR